MTRTQRLRGADKELAGWSKEWAFVFLSTRHVHDATELLEADHVDLQGPLHEPLCPSLGRTEVPRTV